MTGEQHPEMWKPHGPWRPCYRDKTRRPDGVTPCDRCRAANREARARERENEASNERIRRTDQRSDRLRAAQVIAERRLKAARASLKEDDDAEADQEN